jgi:hypothetical protein
VHDDHERDDHERDDHERDDHERDDHERDDHERDDHERDGEAVAVQKRASLLSSLSRCRSAARTATR